MTELEYVLSRFDACFRPWRGRRIVLHGTREYARAIVERFGDDYRFQGVMSLDPVPDGVFCGLPFLGRLPAPPPDEAEPELIILTERVKYAETAFQTLRGVCEARGIAVYNMYGLDEFALHRMAQDYTVEGQLEPEELVRMTEGFGIVAFEIVDTLFPRRNGRLMPGGSLCTLARSLLESGRRVAFSLRKSWSETDQIEAVTALCGTCPPIFPDSSAPAFFSDPGTSRALLIRRQGEDLSFRALRETAGDGVRILYFGGGLVNEFLLPRAYGIESVRFLEQYDCLQPAQRTAPRMDAEQWMAMARAAIAEHEIVSFDVFDTLLLRRVMRPGDVFLLLERRLLERGLPVGRFAQRRSAAQRELPHGTLHEIYSLLMDRMDWTPGQRDTAENEEIALEQSLLCTRADTSALWQTARERGKTLVLTSDMYLPSDVLGGLLRGQGIEGWDALLVSCECGAEKAEGLFKILRDRFDPACRILHFDDRADLGDACERAGVDYCRMPPALDERWNAAIERARSLSDRCLIGSTAAALLHGADPLSRYAGGVVGPLLTGYMAWLCERLRGERFDRLLFFARDGWMPRMLYERLRVMYPDWALPLSLYYYTSRRAAHPLRGDDAALLEDVARQAEQAGLDGSVILKRVFGLREAEILPPEPGETVTAFLLRHRCALASRVEPARRRALRQAGELGLKPGMRCAVSDFFASGSTQADLQTALPISLKGFYAANYKPRPERGCEIEYYLHGGSDRILRGYIALEAVFTSPEPTVTGIEEDGMPRFGSEHRTQDALKRLAEVQALALSFAESWFENFGLLHGAPSGALCMDLFAAAETELPLGETYNDLIETAIGEKNGDNDGTNHSHA